MIELVKENPCTECGIKGLYENCEDKCVQYRKWYQYQQCRADAIEEFDRICEEARGHKFGVCDADFVIDVIKAKVKEQLKEQTE